MFGRLFPAQLDNNFRGWWFAIWLFVPIILLKTVIGVNSIIDPHRVASTADGIPLDSYGAAGAHAVVALFVLLGMWQLILSLIAFVALIRYRAMIPFLYLMLLIQMLANRALNYLHPIAPAVGSGESPGTYVSLGILAATVLGLVLSVLDGGRSGAATDS